MDPSSSGPPPISSGFGPVERIRQQFQSELGSGALPRIEAYLATVPPAERSQLLAELLPIELNYRRSLGHACEADDYRRRFPDHDELVSTLCNTRPAAAPAGTDPKTGPQPSTAVASDVVLEADDLTPAGGDSIGPLRRTWPFDELPRDVTLAIHAEMERQEFAAGDVLIRQGDPSRGLVVIIDGRVEIRVRDAGQWRDVAQSDGAVILGEMSLVTEEPCTATVEAKSPVRALFLPAERFRRLAARHSVLWVALSQLVAERLGRVEVDVLAGKVLNGYRILRAVGRGGMAVVYEAEQLDGGRHVALKMMSHRFTHDLEAQRRFEREMEICQSLDHPNITRIYGCFTSFGTNFMVMEFCDGQTLCDVIRRGPVAQQDVRKVAGQLAAAIGYAHARGVCHRDLKPSNVMIDRSGMLKLMDFGLAKTPQSTDLTQLGNVLGTPRYMPPEQLAGRPVDQHADLFAFGCIVHEMLTGRPLFRGRDILAIIMGQAKWSLAPADEICPGLEQDLYDLLRTCLAKEPTDRTVDLAQVAKWARPVQFER